MPDVDMFFKLLGICFWGRPWSSRWAGSEGGEKGVGLKVGISPPSRSLGVQQWQQLYPSPPSIGAISALPVG